MLRYGIRHLLRRALFSLAPLLLSAAISEAAIDMPDGHLQLGLIVVGHDAPDSVKLAASELRSHIKMVTGDDIPVSDDVTQAKGAIIYLGASPFAARHGVTVDGLRSDGFKIRTGDGWIVILGRDHAGLPPADPFLSPYRLTETYNSKLKMGAFGETGTLFGVYHFLETVFGVRWYMPGPLGVTYTPMSEVKIPKLDFTHSPAYEYRYPYFCFFQNSDEDTLWYRRAGFGAPHPVAINHSFGRFLKYKDSNPEFFALIDGKRDFFNLSTVMGSGNLNLSNPGLIEAAVREANTYFEDNPHASVFPLCPNDGMFRISDDPVSQAQIDRTREYSGEFSNYVWGFINKVAIEVYKTHPNKYIGCIAYERYGLPPTNIEKLSPNVLVLLCKLRRLNFSDKQREITAQRIAAWQEKSDRIYAWEYYCDVLLNPGWKGYPIFYPKIVQQDLQSLRNIIKGEFIESESWSSAERGNPRKLRINFPGIQSPLLYITGRLLWDPDLPLEETLHEFYSRFYGPAEQEMREFWTLVEEAWVSQVGEVPINLFSAGQRQKLGELLASAKVKAGTDTVFRKRIDLIASESAGVYAQDVIGRIRRMDKLKKPSFSIPFFEEIGGSFAIDSRFWEVAPILKLVDRDYLVPSPETQVRLAWAQKDLYVVFSCFEPNIAGLVAKYGNGDQREKIWNDDSVETFLLSKDGRRDLQFIVNSRGAYSVCRRENGKPMAGAWDPGIEVTSERTADQWIVRWRIPWSALGIARPQPGVSISANFCRNRFAGGTREQSSWAPLVGASYYSPRDFGVLGLAPVAPH